MPSENLALERERKRCREKHHRFKEKYNKKSEEYRKNNLKKFSEKAKRMYQKHKTKHKARMKAQSISLKENCEICGIKEKLERHHWNYQKPLMINTLCNPCHMVQHRRY